LIRFEYDFEHFRFLKRQLFVLVYLTNPYATRYHRYLSCRDEIEKKFRISLLWLFKLGLLVLIHQIDQVLECSICGHWNSIQIERFLRCRKKVTATAPRCLSQKSATAAAVAAPRWTSLQDTNSARLRIETYWMSLTYRLIAILFKIYICPYFA
jgi:hypothetical protein